MMNDIQDRSDIENFVNSFYKKVMDDEMLAPVFSSKIQAEAWSAHLKRMYSFWNAILFAERGFDGNPMEKHMRLPIEEKHFAQWLILFTQTVHELYRGPKAEEAKARAASIAQIMNFKIATLRTR